MFGYKLVKTEELDELEFIERRIMTCMRWLSGFKDLNIVWEWILGRSEIREISDMREAYAKARETSVYGKPVDIVRIEEAERIIDLCRRDPLLIEHEARKLSERYRLRYETESKTIRRK